MTGITGDLPEQFIDLPNEAYLKKRAVAQKFGIVQVGMACFVPNHTGIQKNYDVFVYNIWVKPMALSEIIKDAKDNNVIAFESKSINFLNKQSHIDWNKFLVEGVPYLNKSDIAQLENFKRDKILEKTTNTNARLDQLFSEEEERDKNKYIEVIKGYIQKSTTNMECTIENDCTINVLRYISDYIRINYWNKAYLYVPEDENFDIECGPMRLLVFQDEESFSMHLREIPAIVDRKIRQIIGFTQIFQDLLPSKKVLVGHNCFCDMLFMFQHFDDPLPNKLLDFKKKYNETFVNVYDTKVIAEHEVIYDKLDNKTDLASMYNKIRSLDKADFSSPSLRTMYNKGKEPYENQNTYHQAGFDAFMTGYCFLKMKEYWTAIDKKGFIERFKNKIYIYKSMYTLNMSNNEDDVSFKDQTRLWYFKLAAEEKTSKKPGYNDLKRILKLTEDFACRWNSDEDFFLYMGATDSAEYLSENKKPDSNWAFETFTSWEDRTKRMILDTGKIVYY